VANLPFACLQELGNPVPDLGRVLPLCPTTVTAQGNQSVDVAVDVPGVTGASLGSMTVLYAYRIDESQLTGGFERKNVHVQQAVKFSAGAFVVEVEREVT